jgi:hypothetical protein
MPLTLKIHGPGRDTTVVVQNSSRSQSYTFAPSFVPDSVTLDPDGWVLKQVDRTVTAVLETGSPASFVLEQNYPNPFNITTIVGSCGRGSLQLDVTLWCSIFFQEAYRGCRQQPMALPVERLHGVTTIG